MPVTVIILDPPNVTVFPSSGELSVNVTFPALLTCSVFAIPFPNIIWIKNNTNPLASTERIVITEIDSPSTNVRTSILNITSSVLSDESSYTCIASNNITNIIKSPENGTIDLVIQGIIMNTSFLHLLYIIGAPVVKAISSTESIGVFSRNVTLVFDIIAANPPVTLSNVIWEFNGLPLEAQSESVKFSPDKLSVTLSNLTFSNEGDYKVTVSNPAGSSSDSIHLDIQSNYII